MKFWAFFRNKSTHNLIIVLTLIYHTWTWIWNILLITDMKRICFFHNNCQMEFTTMGHCAVTISWYRDQGFPMHQFNVTNWPCKSIANSNLHTISKTNSSISRARIPLMMAFYAKFSSKSYLLLPFNSGASERIRVWLQQKIKKTNLSCWHFVQNFLINPISFIFATIIFMGGGIY